LSISPELTLLTALPAPSSPSARPADAPHPMSDNNRIN
jgi:hypothetical protein